MIRVGVTGAAGRMGRMILSLLRQTEGAAIAFAAEYPGHPLVGRDAGEVAGLGWIGTPIVPGLESVIESCDVVIDFTSAAASLAHLELCAKHGKGLVIGSTGFTPAEREAINSRKDALIFFAPNMSVGMNVLFGLVREATRALGEEFDIEIVEMHHRMKKDSPSGSAVRLAEAVAEARGVLAAEKMVHGREGLVGERVKGEIGMHAVRGGDVVGDHTVIFSTVGERVELTHKASSRETFARGAVRAALWLPGQTPGVHDMLEMLGLP